MTEDASPKAAGDEAGGPLPPARDDPPFTVHTVPPPTAAERQERRDAMERAIRFGAVPYRNAEGRARYVFFREANNAPVEAWTRNREAKRGYRRTQYARKAAGQMTWHPEDQIELGKRLGVLYHREGRSVEGAAERGLYDAIWRYEHVFDSFTVPRRFGLDIIETGRIAAVAEEEARKLAAEDPDAIGGFWVRDRKNNGLIYVVPNRGPEMMIGDEKIVGGENDAILVGQATAVPTAKPSSGALGGGTSWVTSLPPSADDLFRLLRQNLAPIEGGYANRPKSVDPGGPTKKGVSQDLLDKLHKNKSTEYGGYPTATKNLTDTQIDTILRKEIFNPLHLWEVAQIPGLLNDAPQLVDQLFDMGVLHGIDDPGRILQMSLHEVMGIDLRVMKNGKRDYDGIIGPATRSALSQAVLAGRGVEINDLMVDKRLDKLNKQGHKVHNPGWFPRAESFRISPSPLPGTP